MDGAGARSALEAPEWLPKERTGSTENQEAKRRAAIATEEQGSPLKPPPAHALIL